MKAPQPFQYQGSKRLLAATILRYLPSGMPRLVEPFAGSAALSIACALKGSAARYWLNDCNQPLAELLRQIIHHPEKVADAYQSFWRDQSEMALTHYYCVREDFNRTRDPFLLLYLLARCVKGAVRYNANGLFNQSPDKRRLGTRPQTLRHNLMAVSTLLCGRALVTARDYHEVLVDCQPTDVVYMDPPYQGVCGERDARYFSGIVFEDFVDALTQLNERGIRFLLSYDGRLGGQHYGKALPAALDLTHVEIKAGRSAQATLLGRNAMTMESIYLSRSLAEEINLGANMHNLARGQQKIPSSLFSPALPI
ncbi:MAG: DNA adenine methylase [Zoogloeaceae bacterium]|jgi:DNA adenine methylase|nr:DNA adenine methylase [Zoogloeaceae bacterium]